MPISRHQNHYAGWRPYSVRFRTSDFLQRGIKLIGFVQLEAAEGRADELLATLSKAQAYAEKHEPGCLQYRISVDPKNKNNVYVFEVYVSALHIITLLNAERTAERPSGTQCAHCYRGVEEQRGLLRGGWPGEAARRAGYPDTY